MNQITAAQAYAASWEIKVDLTEFAFIGVEALQTVWEGGIAWYTFAQLREVLRRADLAAIACRR